MKKNIMLILFLFSIFLITSCQYPIVKIKEIDKAGIAGDVNVSAPVKVFLKDNSRIVLNKGFVVKNEKLKGFGTRYYFSGEEKLSEQNLDIDSVIAIAAIESDMPSSRALGSFLMSFTAVPLTFLGIYCILCPKCCFGSCPTVYTSMDDKEIKAELFSSSIAKSLKSNDIDRIEELNGGEDYSGIIITNEALETHYIDKLKLTAVRHRKGIKIYNDSKGEFVPIGKTFSDYEAINPAGESISNELNKDDGIYYRTYPDSEMPDKKKSGYFDFIELKINKPQNAGNLKLLVKYRNTLLSTTLYYDVVLASQGVKALDWMNKFDNDTLYAKQFKKIYDMFSGVKLSCFRKGKWAEVTNLADAGPLSWKYIAENIDVSASDDEIKLRLEFFADNIMIDYIGYNFNGASKNYRIADLSIDEVLLNNKIVTGDFINVVSKTDNKYLITEPGDCVEIKYKLSHSENDRTTIFVESNGYYKEWIRGNWIKNNNSDYVFNLSDIQGTINQLQADWRENREILENEFFRTRIPLKERIR